MTDLRVGMGQLGEAIQFYTQRLESAQRAMRTTIELTEKLEGTAGTVREKTGGSLQQGVDELLKKQKEREEEATRELRSLAQIFGDKTSSAALALQAKEFEDRTREIREAEANGLVSHRAAGEVIEKLEADYRALQQIALGKEIGGKIGAELVEKMQAAPGAIADKGTGEIAGIATGVLGLISQTPLAGGLFGLMMYGNSERDRLKAESGEMMNLVVAAGGEVTKGATGHLAAFQERAQKFLGIGRQEIQGIVRTFVDAGLTVDQFMTSKHRQLGEVGHDMVSMTVALDKHFEFAGGTTAQAATQIIKQHGGTLQDAVDSLVKMTFAAQRAGVGVTDLMNTSLQISSELAGYGVSAENVASTMLRIQDKFHEMGISGKTAFTYAKASTSEISGGIRSMGMGVKAYIGESLGLGEGMDAGYALQDAMLEGNTDQLEPIIQALGVMAKTQTKGTAGSFGSDANRQRAYLEHMGFGFEGSRAIVALNGMLTGDGKLKEATSEEWGKLKDSLKTEAQKVSENQRAIAEMYKGLAKIGEGLLVIFANFAALAIISMKALTSVEGAVAIAAMMSGKASGAAVGAIAGKAAGEMTDATVTGAMEFYGSAMGGKTIEEVRAMRGKVQEEFKKYWGGAAGGLSQVIDGAEMVEGGLGKIAGPILQPIKRALQFDESTAAGSALDDEDMAPAMSDEDRARDALFGDAGTGDDGVKQTRHRTGAAAVVNAALARVGHRQKGNESSELSFGRPEWWCMDFVGWAYEQVGFTEWGSFHKSMWGTATTKQGHKGIEAWARNTGNWHDGAGYVPGPGDIFFLERYSGSAAGEGTFVGEHVGMVVDVLEDGTLLTVEGNAVQNGVNGVWQHKRDPGRSSFRGFVKVPKMAGKSSATAAAKAKFLQKRGKTIERKKKNLLKEKNRVIAQKIALAKQVDERAIAEGRTSSDAGDYVSRAPTAPVNALDRAVSTAKATLVDTTTGPKVEVEIDAAALEKGLSEGTITFGTGWAALPK